MSGLARILLHLAAWIVLAACVAAAAQVFRLPEVHVDPAGECVRVLVEGRDVGCADIPDRHFLFVVPGGGYG